VKYDKISFDPKKVGAFLNEDEFIKHCEQYPHYYQDDPMRETKLKTVYKLCKLLNLSTKKVSN